MCLSCADGDEPPAINISITVDEPSETSTAKDPRCVGVCMLLYSCVHCSVLIMPVCLLRCRFDWYQTDRTVVVSFYTFFKVSLRQGRIAS